MQSEFERLMREQGGSVTPLNATVEPDSCIAVTTKWLIDRSKGADALAALSEPSAQAYTLEFHRQHLELLKQASDPGAVGQAQIDLAQSELRKHGLTSVKRSHDGFAWAANVVSALTAQNGLHMIFFRADEFAHCVAMDARGPSYRFFDVNAGEARFDDARALSKAFHEWVWKMGFMQVQKAGAVVALVN
jgi:hypothetical protein